MPAGQPLLVLMCALGLGAIAVLTSPLWMRGAIAVVKGLKHQIREAGSVVDQELTPPDEDEDQNEK